MHQTPPEYERKFDDFIRLCAKMKAQGVPSVVVACPWVLGDNYEELIESLSRLADLGLGLQVTSRGESPSRN